MAASRRQTVLIVDDDADQRALVKMFLAKEGYEVLQASNGADGVDMVRTERPDLVLLDLLMPGMSGLEACQAIKTDTYTRLIPVVVVTASREPEDHVHAVEAGADDILAKPIRRLELLARVRSLLRIKSFYDDLGKEIRRLTDIGISLSSERSLSRLLERIVKEARQINHADGGTLYIVDPDEKVLRYQVVQNETLNLRYGGEHGPIPATWPSVPLNPSYVSAYVALKGELVNIPDVYEVEDFDFSGTRQVDDKNGYHSRSMLVVPMRNHDDEVIGVLQLINAKDAITGEVVPFHEANVNRTHALASSAGIAITNAQLIADLEAFLNGLIQVIADAIDEKSRYTAGHVHRVTQLGLFLGQAVNECPDDRFGNRRFTQAELEELRVAGLLHDTGKVVLPEHVVDKATKLQTVYDRIGLVQSRFSVIRRGMENAALRRKLELLQSGAASEALSTVDAELAADLARLEDDLGFLVGINKGGEFMAPEKLERLNAIAAQTWADDAGEVHPYLTEDEVKNLSIARGTLLWEEMQVIRNHAAVSLRLLQRIPFPRKLRHVPVYAGDHHEMLDGSGYPNKKTAEELPLQSRILAIADIFDALTAADRPYKSAWPLERAYEILRADAAKGKLDSRLVELFISSNCYARLKETEAREAPKEPVPLTELPAPPPAPPAAATPPQPALAAT
jgi:response regulator RpfG family c-di-GMP phosphodiesterase